ncbi:MAG: shikimate dehydrogenase [Bacteroidota bacterium]
MKKVYGLIGFPLGHSFSKKYFTEKFKTEDISGCEYQLFELESIDQLSDMLRSETNLKGFNITIPYKEQIFPFLDQLDPHAAEIGAVNVVNIVNGKLIGYNSDYIGFSDTLKEFIDQKAVKKALILGTGGASKAIAYALQQLGITFQYVSRKSGEGLISYDELKQNSAIKNFQLIINTTPLGTYPNPENAPDIPYQELTDQHYLYDLVYNPAETLFMKNGIDQGAKAINGYKMLVGQAEAAWDIWNSL